MGNCFCSSAKVDSNVSSISECSRIDKISAHSSKIATLDANKNSAKDKKIPKNLPLPRSESEILSSINVKAFSFNELKKATRSFPLDGLLGEGGFGYVYKGWIDQHTLNAVKPGSGMIVAVKKLKPEGFQGHKEWLTEVNYLGQLRHPNLVKLIGYCSERENRLLVYEYMPRGSLENHLFRRGNHSLSWATRIKIATDAARGLVFLHEAENQVIYRDFKASNILLDGEFNAKLSDFGLAKAGPKGDRTHVSTQVMGTQGYAAPEYVATGRLSSKSDVYSFGVVLLELLSGRPAIDKSKIGDEQSLVDWASLYLADRRKLFRIMDVRLEGKYSQKAAFAAASIALECINHDRKLRPRMTDVLSKLEELQSMDRSARNSTCERPDRSARNSTCERPDRSARNSTCERPQLDRSARNSICERSQLDRSARNSISERPQTDRSARNSTCERAIYPVNPAPLPSPLALAL